MARNTAKLGGAASDVVVAKIAVSRGNPLTRPALPPFCFSRHSTHSRSFGACSMGL